MKEEFVIQITGVQTYIGQNGDDDYDDKIVIDTLGSYSVKNSGKFIAYHEMDPDTGKKAPLSIVKVEDGKMTMSKSGAATKLELEPGQHKICAYDTPYGALTMGIKTHELRHELDENGGELFVRYSIYLNNTISTRNTVHIRVKRAEL
ncbi:MAG: DUF1934 domain-containing protein [Clostridia bacterium]|nr:DUF1934 domain-containing protein [Clostridia bacterium]